MGKRDTDDEGWGLMEVEDDDNGSMGSGEDASGEERPGDGDPKPDRAGRDFSKWSDTELRDASREFGRRNAKKRRPAKRKNKS
jgi:hypothetical protein